MAGRWHAQAQAPAGHHPRERHHVLEALVVGGVEEDLGLQLAPRVPVVHDLPAARLVPAPVQRGADVVHRDLHSTGGVSALNAGAFW